MRSLISLPRTIIPACDVELDKFEQLIEATADVEKIGAYKIGFSLALTYGLPKIVEIVRKYTTKPIIYDHQKAATDIPDTGSIFAKVVVDAGVNAIILFPQAGPVTLRAWFQSADKLGLHVIVGGRMTHDAYVASEGGYITDEGAERIYIDAARLGVTDFVVPGNQPEFIRHIRGVLGSTIKEPVFYAPGFIAQKGQISEAAKAAGPRWHAIVGRAIYDNPDIRRAAVDLAASI
jgi:orotidine-5'-phosphate decarboxylase